MLLMFNYISLSIDISECPQSDKIREKRKAFSSQGKVRENRNSGKNQGKLREFRFQSGKKFYLIFPDFYLKAIRVWNRILNNFRRPFWPPINIFNLILKEHWVRDRPMY